jgi:hypothetical protein
LGRVRMRSLGAGIWEASVRFTVPEVRPGEYAISLCNVPCLSAYVGDLMGGWIAIAATAREARTRNLEDSILARLEERNSELTDELWAQLEELRAAVDRARPPSITVGTELRLAPIEDQIKRMSAEIRDLRGQSDQGLPAWLWLAGWLVAGSIAAAWWRSRRSRIASRRGDSSGPGGLEDPEFETLGGPVHFDRVAVSDLS